MKDLLRCLHNKYQLKREISEEDLVLLKMQHNLNFDIKTNRDCIDFYYQLKNIFGEECETVCTMFENLTEATIHDYTERNNQLGRLSKYVERFRKLFQDHILVKFPLSTLKKDKARDEYVKQLLLQKADLSKL